MWKGVGVDDGPSVVFVSNRGILQHSSQQVTFCSYTRPLIHMYNNLHSPPELLMHLLQNYTIIYLT